MIVCMHMNVGMYEVETEDRKEINIQWVHYSVDTYCFLSLLAPASAINAFGLLFQQRVKIEEHPTFFLPSLKASSPSVVDEALKKCSD